jgi:hypothetical protein
MLGAPLALAAPAAAEDIRDIRDPLAIPAWWHWPLAVAVAGLAAFAVVAALRYRQRRRARAATPLERARQALLAAEAHARAGRTRACADLLADTLRAALVARLGTDVLRQTTAELAAASRTETGLAEDVDVHWVVALLETCDLARFARGRLEPNVLVAAIGLSRELVERLFVPPAQPRTAPPRAQVVTP